jgi:hypothetical protein
VSKGKGRTRQGREWLLNWIVIEYATQNVCKDIFGRTPSAPHIFVQKGRNNVTRNPHLAFKFGPTGIPSGLYIVCVTTCIGVNIHLGMVFSIVNQVPDLGTWSGTWSDISLYYG